MILAEFYRPFLLVRRVPLVALLAALVAACGPGPCPVGSPLPPADTPDACLVDPEPRPERLLCEGVPYHPNDYVFVKCVNGVCPPEYVSTPACYACVSRVTFDAWRDEECPYCHTTCTTQEGLTRCIVDCAVADGAG